MSCSRSSTGRSRRCRDWCSSTRRRRASPCRASTAGPITSSQLKDKTYVVNFFNSWCIPCQQEAPALKAFYAEHKAEADFAMVGIIIDDDATTMRGYVRAQDITWPVGIDPNGGASLSFGTTGQPETYVSAIAARVGSQFGDCFIQRLLVPAGNRDFSAFCNEKAGSGQADAAVSAGDESLLACEFHDSSLMTALRIEVQGR